MNLLDRVVKLPMIVRVDKYVKEVLESFDISNPEDLMVVQDGPESATEDARIAEAENMALSQKMGVRLQGNDGLHLGVHQSADMQNLEQGAIMAMKSHIEQHQLKMQADMQKQQMAQAGPGGLQNGQLPNAGGAGPAPTNPGPQPPMGGAPAIPSSPQ